MVFYVSEYVYFQGRHTEGIGLKQPVVYKPKYSMTTLDSRTAPDCRTSQSKGRYCTHAHSIPVVVIVYFCIFPCSKRHLIRVYLVNIWMTLVIARHLNPKLNPQGILKSFCEHVSSRKTHQKKSIETRERKKKT